MSFESTSDFSPLTMSPHVLNSGRFQALSRYLKSISESIRCLERGSSATYYDSSTILQHPSQTPTTNTISTNKIAVEQWRPVNHTIVWINSEGSQITHPSILIYAPSKLLPETAASVAPDVVLFDATIQSEISGLIALQLCFPMNGNIFTERYLIRENIYTISGMQQRSYIFKIHSPAWGYAHLFSCCVWTNTFFSFDAIYFIASVAMFNCWDKNVVAVITLWIFDVCSATYYTNQQTPTTINVYLSITRLSELIPKGSINLETSKPHFPNRRWLDGFKSQSLSFRWTGYFHGTVMYDPGIIFTQISEMQQRSYIYKS